MDTQQTYHIQTPAIDWYCGTAESNLGYLHRVYVTRSDENDNL
jgi:hypothetical protein